MKTCNNCIHAPCCHYLLQHERGYDEYNEQYYDDMDTRCEDFLDKENISNPIDKTSLLKMLKRYQRQDSRIVSEINRLEGMKDNLSGPGNWSLGYHIGCKSTTEKIIDDLADLLGESEENKK